jgi:PAS domain S-box-containing protein
MNNLEEQSWLTNQIVKEAQDAIIMADREGIIRLWNTGAEQIFGYTLSEALGKSLHIIIPENLRGRHDQGYQQAMQSGWSKYSRDLLIVPAINKDGKRISVEFTIILIWDHKDNILGAAAIIRDVSARWEKERAMKRRLADLEAQISQSKCFYNNVLGQL